MVVIQEWWGLNDQMKGIAERCAQAGYTALVPDLYEGRVTHQSDEANHLMTDLDWVGATEQGVRGAVQHLKAAQEKVAVMGFCLGGALTIIAAVKVPEMHAGICYYGIPPADAVDPSAIRVPLQCHFASRDDWCTPAAVEELETALRGGNVEYDLHRYEADHAFFNEAEPHVYDAQCASLSWQRTKAFLETKLSG